MGECDRREKIYRTTEREGGGGIENAKGTTAKKYLKNNKI